MRIVDATHSQYAIHVLDWIFRRPIFRSNDFVAKAGIPEPTARRILRVFRDEGILAVISEASGRRPAVLAFPELIELTER